MYDSKIKASQLVRDIKREVDVAVNVPMRIYADALNYVQQLLYGEIILEQNQFVYNNSQFASGTEPTPITAIPNDNNPDTNAYEVTFPTVSGQDDIRFEDVKQVYFNGMELLRCELRECLLLPDTYAKMGKGLVINIDEIITLQRANNKVLSIIYTVRPEQIVATGESITDTNVAIPNEFIDLAKSYMRAQAYKFANEDGLAGKYLNDFNNELETFKAWVKSHR